MNTIKKLSAGSVMVLMAMIMLLSGSGCGNEEQQRRELIISQVQALDKELKGLDEQQHRLTGQSRAMRQTIASLEQDVDHMGSRTFAMRGTVDVLRSTVLAQEPSWTSRLRDLEIGVYVLLLCLILWLLYRLNQNRMQSASQEEVERVIRNLEREATRAAAGSSHHITAERPAEYSCAPSLATEHVPIPAPAPSRRITIPQTPEKTEAAKAEAERPVETHPSGAEKPKPKRAVPSSRKTGAPETTIKTGKCRVKGCHDKHRSKGFCNKHYQQWRKGTLTEETEGD